MTDHTDEPIYDQDPAMHPEFDRSPELTEAGPFFGGMDRSANGIACFFDRESAKSAGLDDALPYLMPRREGRINICAKCLKSERNCTCILKLLPTSEALDNWFAVIHERDEGWFGEGMAG